MKHVTNMFSNGAKNPLWRYVVRRIVADRDIRIEDSGDSLSIADNGVGATNLIQRYINAERLDRDLVERKLLGELNAIFSPDAIYSRLLVQQHDSGKWELYLDEERKGRIPLSQTGSGLKTVLLVLVNLIFGPILDNKPLSDYIFAFEELENNLHPAIQRRLFRYLRRMAIEHGFCLCITTHSNVVIDLFNGDDQAQLIHVTHDGVSGKATLVDSFNAGHRVLEDLDVRASDLLQTNVVVWVEGPSDRTYFNKWVELWSEGIIVEGVHYQCLPVGGSCNAHFSFESPDVVEELIPTLKINRNAIILLDSDRRIADDKLKVHTQRLKEEVEVAGGYAWVTQGKEVENYIPEAAFRLLFKNPELVGPGPYENAVEFAANSKGNKDYNKPKLARDIAQHLTKEMLAMDSHLAENLAKVCRRIADWNRLEDGRLEVALTPQIAVAIESLA